MKRFLLILTAILTIYSAKACPTYTICGANSVSTGQTLTYSVTESSDGIYVPFSFTVVGGTIISTSRSSYTYSVTITWNVVGDGSITFDQGGEYLDVAVTGCGPDTPNATFSYAHNCNSTVITRTGTAPQFTTWYWQTTASGTSTANSTTTYTASTAGTYYLRPYASCGAWGTALATSAVTVDATPTTANAGPSQNGSATCGLTSVNLNGNTPSVGTGSWSITSGAGGSLGNPASPTSSFSGVSGTSYTLTWTISSGACTPSTSQTSVWFAPMPTTANAGPNQTICTTGSATLAANTPTVGHGEWSVSGPSTLSDQFSNTISPTSTFSPLGGPGTYILTWTISTPICDPSSSSVTITVKAPPTTSSAGSNQTICATGSAVLAANAPAVGTGAWSVSGPSNSLSQFNNVSSPSATFTPAGGAGNYILTWTISNAPCVPKSSSLTITAVAPPTTSNAGTAQTICTNGTATLAGNAPTIGTGTWSVSGPSASSTQFDNTGIANAVFTPAGGAGTYVLTWTITNAPCVSSSSMTITVLNVPLPPTNLGPASVCNGQQAALTATLGANGTSLQWYDPSHQPLSPAVSYPITSPNTHYYVASVNAGCSTQATLTINPVALPPKPVAFAAAPVLVSGSATIYANAADYGSNFSNRWYSVNVGGTSLSSASTFVTPSVSTTTPYYVSTYDPSTSCESVRVTVNAQVLPKIVIPLTVTKYTVRAENITQDTQLGSLGSTKADSTLLYIDGLGRMVQRVDKKASPGSYDIVTPVEYDAQGRTSKDYLPYTKYASTNGAHTGNYQSDYQTQQAYFYNNAVKVAHDAFPFATATYEQSTLGRVLEQGSPGAAWQAGGGHSQRVLYGFNRGATASAGEEVRRFNPDGSSFGFFAANTLTRTQSIDANGDSTTIVYTDGAGRTLAKKQLLNNSIAGVMVKYLETYYIYNDIGQIAYILPPKATAQLKSASWAVSQPFFDTWCFQFTYDYRGRVTQKKSPGQAPVYVAYDNLNRPVLTQTGVLRATNQWQFVKYDVRNRPVMSGIYTDNTNTTLATIQSLLNGLYAAGNSTYPPGSFFENEGTILHGYTNISFPKTNSDGSALAVQNVSYYDNYDFDNNGSDDYSYAIQNITNEGVQARAVGMTTGGKSLVLGTTTWLYSYVFYDKYGRTIQVRANNHLSSAIDNLTTMVYDPQTGLVTQTKSYHNAGGSNQTTTVQMPTYDAKGRLLRINHSINGAQSEVLAQYNYNELGQVVQKNLHCTNCGDPLASQPTTVNAATIQRSAYNSNEPTLLATQMIVLSTGYDAVAANGPLVARIVSAATIPPGGGQFLQNVDYRYNIKGWLTSINNAQLTNDGGATNSDTNDYFGMELAYNTDAGMGNSLLYNGNISAVKWKGAGAATGATGQKSYKYSYDKTNQLLGATFQKYGTTAWDQERGTLNESMQYDHNGNIVGLQRHQNQRLMNGSTVLNKIQSIDSLIYSYGNGTQLSKVDDAVANANGFNDASNQATEYTYDTHGNLTADLNKGISAISYNTLGKVQQINFTNGNVVTYTYDAGGNKLKMSSTASGTTTTTDYVNGYVYNNSTLSFFSSPEGRVVKNTYGNFEYQYAIADNQGNTRVVFTSAPSTTQSVTAGFETANQTSEASKFNNYQTGAHINTVATNAHGGSNSLWLNGGYAGQVGVAKTYKVFPGDQLSIQAYAKYSANSGSSNLAGFASALLTAFNLATPAPGELGTPSAALNTYGGLEAGGWGDGTNDNTDPKVFVNIVLFDQNYKFLDVSYAQLTSSGALMSASYRVKEAGYAYLYVSNENPTLIDVYFDDVTMSYTPTNILQSNDYYPFGLQHSTSWTRDNSNNNFLYNQGSELNAATAMYDLPYRNYDAALGRFHQMDPMDLSSHTLTAYHYAGNNPVGFNDPTGLLILKPIPAGTGQTDDPSPSGADIPFWTTLWHRDQGASDNMLESLSFSSFSANTGYTVTESVGGVDVTYSYAADGTLQGAQAAGGPMVYISADGSLSYAGMLTSSVNSGAFADTQASLDDEDYWGTETDDPTQKGTPWMPYAIAYSNAGLVECGYGNTSPKGEADNQLILTMLLASNNASNGKDSGSNDNAWCASFVNWCLKLAGIQGSGAPGAGSFIGWGVQIDKPVYGAIGVQADAAGNATHVGFYAGESGYAPLPIRLLGGNQGGGTQVQYSNMSTASFTYWCLPTGYGPGN